MSDPKQTTTGEVIHTCGYIHPNTQPCPNASTNNIDGVKSKSTEQELYEAAADLLNFIRSRFPKDFEEGGRGFTCPFHQKLHAAVIRADN